VGHPVFNTNKPISGASVGNGHHISSPSFGGNTAAPIWNSIMNKIDDLLNLSPESFDNPPSSIIGSPPAPPKPTDTPTGSPTGGHGGGGGGGGGNGGGNCKPICPPPTP
jgi:hypothetical protein